MVSVRAKEGARYSGRLKYKQKPSQQSRDARKRRDGYDHQCHVCFQPIVTGPRETGGLSPMGDWPRWAGPASTPFPPRRERFTLLLGFLKPFFIRGARGGSPAHYTIVFLFLNLYLPLSSLLISATSPAEAGTLLSWVSSFHSSCPEDAAHTPGQ